MNVETVVGLVQNSALLVALALLFDLTTNRWTPGRVERRQVPMGIGIAVIGIAIMATPWFFSPGVVFDARSILLSISGLFFGAVTTIVAAAAMAAYRLYQGGAGALTGVAAIAATATVGILWRRVRRDKLGTLSWTELWLVGFVTHCVMLAIMLTLPAEIRFAVVSGVAGPILAVFPIGTMLIGRILVNRLAREREREAIQADEARYRALVESIEAIAWEFDVTSDRWTYVAPQVSSILGWDPADWTDLAFWAERIHPKDRDWATTYCAGCTARGEDHTFEYRFRCKDGSYRWLRDVVNVETRGVQPVKMRGFMIDITHTKEAEEAANEASTVRETLLAELRHRTKNYIAMIVSLVRLEKAHRGSAPADEALEDVERRITVLGELFDMLQASGSSDVRLDEYLRSLCGSLGAALSSGSPVKIATSFDEATVDQRRASSVGLITNELVTNAMKYAGPGSINVTLEARDDSAVLKVVDDGVGLPSGFDPAASPGLGLQLVQALVSQLGGSATWTPGQNGRGVAATVSFTLAAATHSTSTGTQKGTNAATPS